MRVDLFYVRLQGPFLGVPHHSYVGTLPHEGGNEHIYIYWMSRTRLLTARRELYSEAVGLGSNLLKNKEKKKKKKKRKKRTKKKRKKE